MSPPWDSLGRTPYAAGVRLLAGGLRNNHAVLRHGSSVSSASLHTLAGPYTVRSLARAGLVAAQREESKAGSPCPSRVPSQPFAVPLPCFCHVQDCMVETYLTC